MVQDAERFAEEDKKQREAIDARNQVRPLSCCLWSCCDCAWSQRCGTCDIRLVLPHCMSFTASAHAS